MKKKDERAMLIWCYHALEHAIERCRRLGHPCVYAEEIAEEVGKYLKDSYEEGK